MPEYYEVYLARFQLAMQDPDLPSPRFHTAIFVKTTKDESGTMYEVTGDVTSAEGMVYNAGQTSSPQHAEDIHSFEKIGITPISKHPAVWESVLGNIPTPPQQKAFNIKTMRTEPFKTKEPLTFYEPGESRRPLLKCTEWTMDQALPALRQNGLLIQQ